MKKIGLMLAFTFLISLVWSLEYDTILSVSEESISVASKDSTLYVASINGVSIYNYSNEILELVNMIYREGLSATDSRVYSSGNYLIHDIERGAKILYDITDSENPVEITTLGGVIINDCIVVDDYLLVRSDGVYVYDTQDFYLPPTQILTSGVHAKVVDNKLFQLTYNSENHRELREYTMNLPSEAELVDSLEINDTGALAFMVIQNERIFVREKHYLYVFAYSNGLELLQTFGPLPTLDYNEYNLSTNANDSTLICADGYYWDISDVNNIVQYQDWRTNGQYYYRTKATIIGDYYIKPNGEYGLVIVDMSDIENVEIIYDMSSYYNAVGIDIVGNTLIDVAYPKLKMFDVSSSENRQVLSQGEERDWNNWFKKFLTTEDKLLLVNDDNLTILNTENGVASPEFCSTIELGSIGQIATYDDYFYNIDGESLQMQITDISEPESPEILGSVGMNEIIYAPISSYVIDHYLLLVNEYLRVSVYDLSNPTEPEYLSSFSCNILLGIQHIADKADFEVKDNLLYVSFINGFWSNTTCLSDIFIVDISDIENWLLLNTISDENEFSNDIEVVGDYLYSVSNRGAIKINMYQLDGFGGFSEVASYNTETVIPSMSSYFKVHNNKLYLSRGSLLICYDIIYYTENDSYEIVPSNQISSYNYPNPFNPETTISFDLPQRDKVEIAVYNIRGQKVRTLLNEEMSVGTHKIIWNGTNNQGKEVASGVYYYRLSSGKYTKTNKMVLMK